MRRSSSRIVIGALAACALVAGGVALEAILSARRTPREAIAGPAFAPPTIAVFDLEQVLAGSRRRAEMEDELKREFEVKRGELDKLRNEIKKYQEELGMMKGDSPEHQRLERLVHQKTADAEFTEKQFTEEIERLRTTRFQVLLTEIQRVVAELAGARGIDLVLQRKLTLQDGMPSWEAVFHALPELDVTRDLIETLNKQ
ncbi:MAG: OmpH family outer membrane protein [Planctomycetes bacterium]|nr:OmpH family outer membrane protein [Planctomycetota bacterium]